jgi:ABC-type transport system involved in Fe-S cluster assembly fused permease/ATPase subunit
MQNINISPVNVDITTMINSDTYIYVYIYIYICVCVCVCVYICLLFILLHCNVDSRIEPTSEEAESVERA